jgi:hypothetical protein
MIRFGEKWIAEGEWIFHACEPDVRTLLGKDRSVCECGALASRVVRSFRDWMAKQMALVVPLNASEDGESTAERRTRAAG